MERLHQKGYRFVGKKEQVKECFRKTRKKAQKENQQVPKRCGKLAKAMLETITNLQKETERLRMENELLRNFFSKESKGNESKRGLCDYRDVDIQVPSQLYMSIFQGIPLPVSQSKETTKP